MISFVNRLSLKFRIALIIFLLEAVMLVVVLEQTLGFTFDAASRQEQVRQRMIQEVVSEVSLGGLVTLELADLQLFLSKIVKEPIVDKIVVSNYEGTVVASIPTTLVGRSHEDVIPSQGNTRWIEKPVKNASGILGTVAIAYSDELVVAVHRQALLNGVIIAAAGMLIVAAVGLLAGFALTRRLDRIAFTVTEFASGNNAITSGISGSDELGMLGLRIDTMIEEVKNNQTRLMEEKNKQETLLSNLPGLAYRCVWNDHFTPELISEGARHLTGINSDDMMQHNAHFRQLIHEDDAGVVNKVVDDAVKSQKSFDLIYRMYDQQGNLKWVWEKGKPVAADQGDLRYMVGFISDITEKIHAEQALRDSEAKYRLLYESMEQGVVYHNSEGRIVSANPAALRMLKTTEEKLRDPAYFLANWDIVDENGEVIDKSNYPVLKAYRDGAKVNNVVLGLKDKSTQELTWFLISAVPQFREGEDRPYQVFTTFIDITQRKQAEETIWRMAYHDSLTGLVNRWEFENRLERALRSTKERGIKHALFYIDLDQFKVINDTCGHSAGDKLLKQISGVFLNALRDRDTVARLGGDEFGVLLENCPLDRAEIIAEHILDAIKGIKFVWNDDIFLIGASIGIVGIDESSSDVADILKAADMACYAAKDHGRNRFHVYRYADLDMVRRKGEMQWVARLNDALAMDKFVLFKQNIVSFNGGRSDFDKCEILLRIREEGNLITPDDFIPAAERYNIMPRIDRWVINRVCALMQQHQSSEVFFVNVSGISLNDEGLIYYIREQIDTFKVDPSLLCFEVTESAAITNLSRSKEFLTRLREAGCRFALDDFGSGLSSFNYLKHLPVDYLKIYGDFVVNILAEPIDRTIVDVIAQLGGAVGIKIIAEHVESEAIQAELMRLGIHYGQGFHIHRPEPLHAQEALQSDSNDKSKI